MPMKVAMLVHHRNYQEPAGRSQDAYHPDPASPPGSAGSIAAPASAQIQGRRRRSGYLLATSTDVQACSLQQPAIKHRGQPTTAHPEARSRCPRKILVAQATAIPLKRPARHLHRKTPPMRPTQRTPRKNHCPNSSSQDDASKKGTTSKTPSSPDLACQI
jgi:hypothetical protein